MIDRHIEPAAARAERWLKQYYFVRAAFSIVWVALAFAAGRQSAGLAAILLVIYPAWDAVANYLDLSRSGGMTDNRTQTLNVLISTVTTVAVAVALTLGPDWVLRAFGLWAIVSGLLQLGTALRRWKRFGAQWPMVLSGAQSALAGVLFIVQAEAAAPPAIVKVAGYAGVGAAYFLISAVWLAVRQSRRPLAQQS